MKKSTIILEGLSCANCANNIENQTKKINGVDDASVDFISRKLNIETSKTDEFDQILEEITAIVKRAEPNIKVILENMRNEITANRETGRFYTHRKEISRLAIGGTIFAVALIFNFDIWLELSLFLISYLIVGADVLWRAVKGIIHREVFNEHFLMSIATIGAFLVGEYPEGVAVMLFYLVGELFQEMAVDHSRKSIGSLMDIRPDYANLKVGEEFLKVSPEDVNIGDIILVKPGEKIPLDGIVVEGSSIVDTSALTGESVPSHLEPGQDALSGFINKNGVLMIDVVKKFEESTVSKILDLVENAASKKAKTEKLITKFAKVYTPIIVFAALIIAFIPPLIIEGAVFSDWIYRSLVFLVISCPCALVISIPLGFFGGIGGASKRGILVKGSNYLEALNSVDTVAFDKTGTLTKGIFSVTQINSENGYTRDEILENAAYAEYYSNHPIANSIINSYKSEIDKSLINNYQEIAGYGVKANINGRDIMAGNSRLMSSEGIEYKDIEAIGSIVHVSIDRKYVGNIVISDEIKDDSKTAIDELRSLGIRKTVMLTGDLMVVADKIGNKLGVDEVYAELLPADKVNKLEQLDTEKSRKGNLVFVGDGINDAPVLARADIGIAMGGLGSDAAIEVADIIIMNDEPSKVALAIKIAKKTRKIVYQNIVFALGVKLMFLIMGTFGITTMWEAVFADTGVALLAIFNSLRVMNTKNM